jgi:hypothetical protein
MSGQSKASDFEYAKRLATWLWAEFYKSSCPEFELLDDMLGVLSQIDNMLSGIEERTRQQIGRELLERSDEFALGRHYVLTRRLIREVCQLGESDENRTAK